MWGLGRWSIGKGGMIGDKKKVNERRISYYYLIFNNIIRNFAMNLKLKIMARPIKETPVITGKDAKRFAEKMAHLKPESKEEKEAAKRVYEKFKARAACTF